MSGLYHSFADPSRPLERPGSGKTLAELLDEAKAKLEGNAPAVEVQPQPIQDYDDTAIVADLPPGIRLSLEQYRADMMCSGFSTALKQSIITCLRSKGVII